MMIIDKIAVILVATILTIYLAVVYIKKQAAENLVILSLLSFSMGIYIPFTIYKVNIPIYIHIAILVFGLIIPFIAVLLQYNNIMVSSKILYRNAKKLYNNEKYELAIKELLKLVDMDEKKTEYLYLLGMAYENIGEYANARDNFALAVDIDKEDYKSYYELGKVLDKTGKTDSAIVMFEKALKICPEMYEAYEALGICLTSQEKYSEAVKVYREAVKYYSDSYELYYNLAVLEMHLQEYKESEKDFKVSISLNPELYAAYFNIANIEYLKGDYDNAIESYKKVLTTEYSDKAYYKIAMIYAIKKEYEKAMTIIEYLVELDSRYIDIIGEEFIFSSMREKINNYLFTRAKNLLREKEQKGLIKSDGKTSKVIGKLSSKKEERNKKPNILNSKLI